MTKDVLFFVYVVTFLPLRRPGNCMRSTKNGLTLSNHLVFLVWMASANTKLQNEIATKHLELCEPEQF